MLDIELMNKKVSKVLELTDISEIVISISSSNIFISKGVEITIPKNIAIIKRGVPAASSPQLIVYLPSEYIVLTIKRSRLKINNPQNIPKQMART